MTWLGVVTPSRPLTSWQALFTIGTGSSLYGPLSNDLAPVPEQSSAEEPQMGLEERRVRALELLAKSASELVQVLDPRASAP
jgi:hypothetical protein